MNTLELISQAYAAFNQRDIDGTLATMTDDVSWPKASEGGRVVGKESVRAYWTRQWADFDPHVDVLEMVDRQDGRTEVKVHQLVKDLKGNILSDMKLWHIYTVEGGLLARMDILETDGNTEGRSSAFAGEANACRIVSESRLFEICSCFEADTLRDDLLTALRAMKACSNAVSSDIRGLADLRGDI